VDIESGDEVILPSDTFGSTAHASYARRVPVSSTSAKTPSIWKRTADRGAITPRTRAIVTVHYAAFRAEMDAIIAIARRHDLWMSRMRRSEEGRGAELGARVGYGGGVVGCGVGGGEGAAWLQVGEWWFHRKGEGAGWGPVGCWSVGGAPSVWGSGGVGGVGGWVWVWWGGGWGGLGRRGGRVGWGGLGSVGGSL